MDPDLATVEAVELDVEALEAGICAFQARLAAATAVYLAAVAEYDRRKAWERWDMRSMAHWLAWRCGTSLVTAREQVRVGAALVHLPVTGARFRAGQLSYSQVRAITRVADADTDEPLADLAQYMTSTQLEGVVRSYRKVHKIDEAAALARRRRREVSWGYDEEGNLVGRFCLPADEGAVVARALEAGVGPAEAAAAAADGADYGWAAARADALVEMATAYLAGVREGRPPVDDDRCLVRVLVDASTLAGVDHPDAVCEAEDGGPGLAPETVRRLACDQPTMTVTRNAVGYVADVGRRTRRVGRRLKRALRRRDGGCRYPGCTATRTDAHHIVHWADGGPTSMANLVSLCPTHHHRHHEGGYRIEQPPGRGLVFVQADGTVVPDRWAPSDDVRPAGGLAPTAHPFESSWDGSNASHHDIVWGLCQTRPRCNDPATGWSDDRRAEART